MVWQLPPNFKYDHERLRDFLQLLPHDTASAAAMARRRDAFMKGRARLTIDANRPLRHAIEVRHDSFATGAFIELLRKHNVALVISESARQWPMIQDVTADFIYMRLHGDKALYRSGYGGKALDQWARRIADWARGSEPADAKRVGGKGASAPRMRDVYCFFDNTDVKLRAPFDAQTLIKKLRLLH
jgi:uncharacterized protein YecE (DUF72 family)